MYYGMQFAQRFAGFGVAQCGLKTDANVTAYLGTKGGRMMLAIVNKGAEAVRVESPEEMRAKSLRGSWVLRGPVLSAKEGVRFEAETVPGKGPVEVPGYSALLLQAG